MSCNLEQMTPYGYVMQMEGGGGSYRIFSLITEVITREVSGVSEKDENRKPNKCVDKILYPSSSNDYLVPGTNLLYRSRVNLRFAFLDYITNHYNVCHQLQSIYKPVTLGKSPDYIKEKQTKPNKE